MSRINPENINVNCMSFLDITHSPEDHMYRTQDPRLNIQDPRLNLQDPRLNRQVSRRNTHEMPMNMPMPSFSRDLSLKTCMTPQISPEGNCIYFPTPTWVEKEKNRKNEDAIIDVVTVSSEQAIPFNLGNLHLHF